MADVDKYGRTFQFEDNVPDDTRAKRIDNWMRQNAPDELQPAASTTPQAPAKGGSNQNLASVARTLGMPLGALFAEAASPSGRDRLTDVNTYRTLAQGAIPFADEATAGVRSILPGQPDYSTALAQERKGVKDYGDKYGEGDKIATELLGAGLGTAATLGVGSALQGARGLPWLAKAGEWMAANPWKSAIGTGAGSGAVAGFGAGEGGLGPRLESAKDNAALGAALGPLAYAGTRAVDKGMGWLSTDNRVADFLRRKLASQREDVATSQTLPRTKTGDLDVNTPEFTDAAVHDLRTNMGNQRNRLYTDPMLADLLPGMTEQVLQKPGTQSEQLARNLVKRQFDDTLPATAQAAKSQRGRVENAFDLAFGADNFKKTDEQLLSTLRSNADAAFKPAYQSNIRSPEIDDALDRIRTLNPNIWTKAKSWADAERRPIGSIDVTGNLSNYNTQFLHDIKRSMDESLGEAGRMNPKFNDRPYLDAKVSLNNAMKDANPEYKTAMEQYGDDASRISALKKGREEAFPTGSVDVNGGMKGEDIKNYLADPAVTGAEKDLFKVGAARALRERVLASNSKKDTHNWADVIGNPETRDRMEGLLTDKLGSWDLLNAQLKKENENFKGAARAMGNSRTNARQEMSSELEGADMGRLAAGITNPTAYGNIMTMVKALTNKVNPAQQVRERTANLLGRTGAGGNRSALRDVESLLRAQDARRGNYSAIGSVAPSATAWAWPYREEQF